MATRNLYGQTWPDAYLSTGSNDNTIHHMNKTLLPALAALAACTITSFAEMGGPPNTGFNAALTKLFGTTTAFSAQCDVRVLDNSQKEKTSMPMQFALLDNKVRVEIDMTKVKGQGMTAEQAEQIKQMGMERIISIIRPDKKTLNLIYPAMQSCVTMPLPKEDADAIEKEPKMEKTSLGKETLDGHACEKSKVILTDANGKKSEAVVWAATDLKDFPIQIQTTEKSDTVILRYSKIQFAKPDEKLFDVPAGYTTYDNMQAFGMGVMQKMMGGAAKP
jgi:hypothetical protein